MSGFQNLSILAKFTCAIVVLLFPILLLGYFLVTEKEELIAFTRQEIAGVNYLRAAQQALVAATSSRSVDSLAKSAESLKKAEQEDAGALGVTQKTRELVGFLQQPSLAHDENDLVAKSADMISVLSDNSNITLDPDGDAYFIGDILVNQATAVLTQSRNLALAAQELDKVASDDNKVAYAEARDGISSSAGNLATDLAKAIKGNSDGSLKLALEADGTSVADAAAKLADAAKGNDRPALVASISSVQEKVRGLLTKTDEQMERLLNGRIAGFQKVLVTRLGIAFIAVLLGGAIVFSVVRSITRPLNHITGLMGRLTSGDLDMTIPKTARRDEIGVLTRSLHAFHEASVEREKARKLELERAETESKRAQLIQRVTAEFETKVQVIVNTVASASTELAQTAEAMTGIMETTTNNARSAAKSAMETTSNVNSVASAAEEMSASVKEISAQVQRTNTLAIDSRKATDTADNKASALGNAAQKVRQTVTLIAGIAGQINLLALNATIESARAGEAGKGFAVVASEVKNLANQTNRSVEEVDRVIEELNDASTSIIESLSGIKDSVGAVSTASGTIAAAVEEQSATTSEITRSMTAAAQGTQVISDSLKAVSDLATQASSAATQVLGAARELSQQSESLNSEVGQFLMAIRAA